jgi:hypothetical protein
MIVIWQHFAKVDHRRAIKQPPPWGFFNGLVLSLRKEELARHLLDNIHYRDIFLRFLLQLAPIVADALSSGCRSSHTTYFSPFLVLFEHGSKSVAEGLYVALGNKNTSSWEVFLLPRLAFFQHLLVSNEIVLTSVKTFLVRGV